MLSKITYLVYIEMSSLSLKVYLIEIEKLKKNVFGTFQDYGLNIAIKTNHISKLHVTFAEQYTSALQKAK